MNYIHKSYSIVILLFISCLLVSCDSSTQSQTSFTEERKNFTTNLVHQSSENIPVEELPGDFMQVVSYPSPVGDLAAYLSSPADISKKHPAIIWIFGGFSNSIGYTAWEDAPAENDQSASAFWKAGIVTMYPSQRGGNQNPGHKEGFYGEVDDIIAAYEYLAKQPFVDPEKIYLGGHSTGGTLALLTACTSTKFSAIFAFGPVEDTSYYGQDNLPFDVNDPMEAKMRSPIDWLANIDRPTFVFEGAEGNINSLKNMHDATDNPLLKFYPILNANHFSTLAPLTKAIAKKIQTNDDIQFTQDEVNALFN